MKIHSGAHCADFGLAEEVYLTGKISPRKKDLEQRMMNANLLPVSKQLKNAENEENIGD